MFPKILDAFQAALIPAEHFGSNVIIVLLIVLEAVEVPSIPTGHYAYTDSVCVFRRTQGTGINIVNITISLCFLSCLRHCLVPSTPVENHVFYYMIMFIIAFEAMQGP